MAQTTGIPTIGETIRAWRKFRRLSSTKLAEKAVVRIGYLSEIEHDRRTSPRPEYLEKLASALKIPLQVIYGRRMPPDSSGSETTPSSKPPVPRQSAKTRSSQSTVFHAPLSISLQEILMHRLAVLKEKVEAAEKNLRDMREELLEVEALAVDIFGEEESHAPTTGGV
jgi:transcriptional regulator with XRE-family HTH domain